VGGRLIEEAKSWQQVDSTHPPFSKNGKGRRLGESRTTRGADMVVVARGGHYRRFRLHLHAAPSSLPSCWIARRRPPHRPLDVIQLELSSDNFSHSLASLFRATRHFFLFFFLTPASSFLSSSPIFPLFVLPSASVLSSVVKVTIHSSLFSDLKRIMKFD
jgi:hypothetical protein